MPINVHLIRTHYPHWGVYSGINQFVKYLDAGQYAILERLVSDSDEDFPIRHGWVRKFLRAPVRRRGMPWYQLSDLIAEFRALVLSGIGNIDVLHYLDGEHSALFLPGLLKRTRKRPKLLATYHQPPEVLDSLIIKDVVVRLDCITVVSPEQEAYFRTFVPNNQVRLTRHGIDTDFFRPTDAPERDENFRCLTVGHYLRDFNAVREVAQRLLGYREIEFHVVSSQAQDHLRDLPNIRVYNGIDDASLLKLYQHADILFLPLIQSTANNALLEAIACGLPVVSTQLTSVRYYLPGEEAILIENNDPDELTSAIADLLRHPDKRIAMGQAARRRAEALDWRRIAADFAAVYSKLAGS